MHRLVHLATRIWINKYGDLTKLVDDAIRPVTKVFPHFTMTRTNKCGERTYHMRCTRHNLSIKPP